VFSKSKTRLEEFEAAAMPLLADLYRTARFMTRDSTEAEDLVQETCLEGWKSFHRFEPGTNCRAWLFTILFHRIHHFRRRQLKLSRMEPFESVAEADNVMASPPVPQEIRDEDILAALGKLPPEFREVVVLADIQEFSYRETAEALKIPLGTVMSRLSRGRKLLRTELEGVARAYGIGGIGRTEQKSGEGGAG
jgi:RNA polymerase sigma-70 factor (ECF subfamily)